MWQHPRLFLSISIDSVLLKTQQIAAVLKLYISGIMIKCAVKTWVTLDLLGVCMSGTDQQRQTDNQLPDGKESRWVNPGERSGHLLISPVESGRKVVQWRLCVLSEKTRVQELPAEGEYQLCGFWTELHAADVGPTLSNTYFISHVIHQTNLDWYAHLWIAGFADICKNND